MSEVEVTIYAPYDQTVSSVVLEESLPVWESLGWTRAQSLPQESAQPAQAAQPAQPAPQEPAPAASSSTSSTPSGTPSKS